MGEPIIIRNDKPLDHTDDMVKDTPDDTPTSVEKTELETLKSPEPGPDTFDKDDTFETLDKENIMKEQLDLMKEVISEMSVTPPLPPLFKTAKATKAAKAAKAAGGSI